MTVSSLLIGPVTKWFEENELIATHHIGGASNKQCHARHAEKPHYKKTLWVLILNDHKATFHILFASSS